MIAACELHMIHLSTSLTPWQLLLSLHYRFGLIWLQICSRGWWRWLWRRNAFFFMIMRPPSNNPAFVHAEVPSHAANTRAAEAIIIKFMLIFLNEWMNRESEEGAGKPPIVKSPKRNELYLCWKSYAAFRSDLRMSARSFGRSAPAPSSHLFMDFYKTLRKWLPIRFKTADIIKHQTS